MKKWHFDALEFNGAFLITPFFSPDERGGLVKDYSKEIFSSNGINHELTEVFYTLSKKGVVRAIHFQRIKQQPKLVRCISGKIFDVIVDLRKDSPTFKKWKGFILSGDNMVEILVPEGFGHGYLVLEDSIVSYKCSEKFYQEYDSGIRFDDPDIGVEWPYDLVGGKDKLVISNKDENLQSFKDFIKNYDQFISK